MSYELDDTLPPDVRATVDPGTNILVSGPSMSGKRNLLLRSLEAGSSRGDGAVVVTTSDAAPEVIEDYEAIGGDTRTFFRVIDCVGSQGQTQSFEDVVRTVSSPGDLTGIGIEFSEIGKSAESSGVSRLRVAFDSISPLLMYVDLQRVFRFLHVFTSQIQSRDWLGLFAIDPQSHDEQAVNTISQLFDGVVEIRLPESGGREVRTRGFDGAPSSWTSME
ncbi:MAG: RAD55 family ATPase [Halodesulfurarchaeum sp.]